MSAHPIPLTAPSTVRPELTALARLAAHALNAPAACIVLRAPQRLHIAASQGLTDTELNDLSHAPADHLTLDTALAGWHACAIAPLLDDTGAQQGSLAVLDRHARPVSERQHLALLDLAQLTQLALRANQQTQQIQRLAMSDALTGLSNRAHFERALHAEFARAARCGKPFTLLLIDLEGFKAVNDGFGHGAGDETLQEISLRLQTQVRAGDVLARLSGDEFGILMRDGPKESARALARRIVRAISAPIALSSGDEVGVGASLGMAAYTDHTRSVRQLLSQAEQALYENKQHNERRWKLFVGEPL